jgi:alanine racemase
MDYTSIDVGHIPGVSVGDRVTIVGTQGAESITLEDLAQQVGTIPYELSCAVGKRVERIYKGGEEAPSAANGVLFPRVSQSGRTPDAPALQVARS